MNISGQAELIGSPESVCSWIFKPACLIHVIPGCQSLIETSPGEYEGIIRIGVAAVSGSYTTFVKITEERPPETCRLTGEITGPTGSVTGTASLRFIQEGQNTRLFYNAQALFTGPLAKINPRIIEGMVKALISQGLSKLNENLETTPNQSSEIAS